MTAIAIAAIFTFVMVRSSYPALRFLAGIAWWGVGVWFIYNPLMTGANPVNDIMLIICFFGGFLLMVMMNWQNGRDRNGIEIGGMNIRMPRIFGGQSEEEENADRARQSRTSMDKRLEYQARIRNRLRG